MRFNTFQCPPPDELAKVTLEIQIITDLSIIMVVAAFVTFVFHKLGQPLVVGYIIAGIIIGPYTPPSSLISQPEFLQVGAQLGVILLLFGIGLEFPLSKLRKVGRVSVGVASIEVLFMIVSGYGLGYLILDCHSSMPHFWAWP
jgi:CPA2 family monovalent cation:H+ antiporter-2